MVTFLARMAAVTLLGATLMPGLRTIPQTVQEARQALDAHLAPLLAPASIRQLLNEDAMTSWSSSAQAQQFAATRRRRPSPVIKLPPGTRKRLVQAFPVDPRAVPSMTVGSPHSS